MSNLILDDKNTLFLPVEMVTDNEFAAIKMRGITNALPACVLDNGGYPNRELRFWPVPNSTAYAIELWLWEPLEIYGLDDELDLPPGYERWLIYALALELADIFGKTVTQEMVASFTEAETNLESLNQVVPVSTASEAVNSMTSIGGAYNYIDFISGANMLPRKVTSR